jgi:hypothetical protein
MDEREVVLGPPKGFRKAISTITKLRVVLRQVGRCHACGEPLGDLENTEFDHNPALQRRLWDLTAEDTFPPANDPEHIEAKHKDCHKAKTTGRKGESKLSISNGDAQEIAKLRRLERRRAEDFSRALLAPSERPPENTKKQKRPWPSRPFPKRQDKGLTR